MRSNSQTPQPDFAYPKSTAEIAAKDLNSAVKADDAHAALNALIRYSVATVLIDGTKPVPVFKKALETADKFTGSDIYGLYLCYLAKMYESYYESDRWTFDQRSLPVTPLPADVTEWSGEQFRYRIRQLCDQALSADVISRLAKLDITAYGDIIKYVENETAYFPTLADFAYSFVSQLYDTVDIDNTGVMKQALAASAAGTAPWLYWTGRIDMNTDDPLKALRDSFAENNANPYADILLVDMLQYVNDLDQTREFVSTAQAFVDAHSDCFFSKAIRENIVRMKNPQVEVSCRNLVGVDADLNVKVHSENATAYKVNVYFLTENIDKAYNKYDSRRKVIKNCKLVQSIDVTCGEQAPFRTDTVLTLKLDKPGFYAILPDFPMAEKTDEDSYRDYVSMVRCVPVYPVVLNGARNEVKVLVVDPSTGFPVKNATVRGVSSSSRKYIERKVDADGMCTFTPAEIKFNSELTIVYDNKAYPFDGISMYAQDFRPDKDTSYSASILTGRSVYHPGDRIDVLVVAQRTVPDGEEYRHSLLDSTEIEVALYNPNGVLVESKTVTTDQYGRAPLDFTAPADGLTGYCSVRVTMPGTKRRIASRSVMVSDYKMPDYEVSIDVVACDTPTKGAVTLSGNAASYSGMPMSDVKLTFTLTGITWWWRSPESGDKLYSVEAQTDAEGRFSVVLPDSAFTAGRRNLYNVTVDAVAPNGSTASASRMFSLDKVYNINLNIATSNIDGTLPLKPEVRIVDAEDNQVEIPLRWKLVKNDETVAEGDYFGEINISAIKPGSYTLVLAPEDAELAQPATANFVIYNVKSGIVPDDDALWVLQNTLDVVNGRATIDLATGSSDATCLYYMLDIAGNITWVRNQKLAYGYHKLDVEIPADCKRADLTLLCVKGGKVYSHSLTLRRKADAPLVITGESFRDKLIPTAQETWTLKVTRADGTPVQGAMALDMYNKALDAILGHSFDLHFNTSQPWINSVSLRNPYSSNINNSLAGHYALLSQSTLVPPVFNLYSYDLWSMPMVFGMARPMMARKAMTFGSAIDLNMSNSFSVDACVEESEEDVMATADMDAGGAEAPTAETFDYRDSDVPMAVWAPSLTTDADGNVVYSFTVPNANTTWRLYAVAWSRDLEVGQMMREFVASKPVMVQPNLPRFLRNGDKATLMASVMNNSDAESTITTVVEIFNPVTGQVLSTHTTTDTIAANQSANVSVDVNVGVDASAIGYRVRSGNGEFSDGEQSVIRVLSAQASLIETYPFYLNPGDRQYATTLPDEKNARLSLTFCENPVWTIVTALPGLRTDIQNYANSAAAAIFSAAISGGIMKSKPEIPEAIRLWKENPQDSVLVSMLEKNEDLKLAVLNSTPWVQCAQSETERMANLAMTFDQQAVDASISQGIDILRKLQRKDGGWSWGLCWDESSVWVTANVLAMMSDLKAMGWLPKDKALKPMIEKAVKYYDSKVRDTDLEYTLVRAGFPEISVSANGRKVIKATIKMIKKDWKHYSSPSHKAMCAMALYLNGEQKLAQELMRSVAEFGVYTPSQGLKFPSDDYLSSYTVLLEAFALICPQSECIDGLRQQLIVRKQGADWGSAVVTTEVVRSILSTGSKWTVSDSSAKVEIGGTEIVPDKLERITGSLRADISSYSGKELTITTPGTGPAYGAVYAQFEKQMDEVKASSCDDLSIEKQMYVRRGTEWIATDRYSVGDRVKVQLVIHCDRNLEYVTIVDERPAAFSPVDQLPGWMYSEGVAFYRENRDAQTDMHVIYMRPGTYLLTYEMDVTVAGTFSSGVASIQSQYAPELSAHSGGCTLRVE